MESTNGQSGAFPSGRGTPSVPPIDTPDLDRLTQDFHTFVADCEALFRNARTLSGQGTAYARAELSRRLDDAWQKFGEVREAAGQRAVQVRASTEDYVRREPLKAVGVAAALGVLIALLMSRRS
jgi:ElaB/YqjD/DUF883 family membrane-anchored ribosome-binding protein